MANLDGADYPYSLFEYLGIHDINSDKILGLEDRIDSLDRLDYLVITKRFKEGKTVAIISEELNISKSVVQSSIKNSCVALRFSNQVIKGYTAYNEYITKIREDVIKNLKEKNTHILENKLITEEPICLPSGRLIPFFGADYTVGELVKFINKKGSKWYSAINGLGVKNAELIESILREWNFKVHINRDPVCYCSKCKKGVSSRDNFCRSCGNSLKV